MEYLTAKAIQSWAKSLVDGTYYCFYCLTELKRTDDGKWYCPNEMCLYEEQGKIKKGERQ